MNPSWLFGHILDALRSETTVPPNPHDGFWSGALAAACGVIAGAACAFLLL